jgi:hypothetical protein
VTEPVHKEIPPVREAYHTGTDNRQDHTEAASLFRHVYGDGAGYLSIFSGVRAAGEDGLRYRRQRFFEYPKELASATGHAADSAGEPGREVYFSAHLLTEQSRKKGSAAPVSCLFSEIDGTKPNDVIEKYATAIVESSPGNFHVYIRLS